MTSSEPVSTPDEPIESAPWPVPEGSRLEPVVWAVLDWMLDGANSLEGYLVTLIQEVPVKRDLAHAVYLHDLALVIDRLETIQDRLKIVREAADEAFCRGLPFQTSNVSYADTRAMIPRFGGERVKWANDLLQADVHPRLLTDPESGEKRSAEEAVATTLDVVSLNGSNAKVGGLRRLGLDPDDYCHKVPKAPSVQVVK